MWFFICYICLVWHFYWWETPSSESKIGTKMSKSFFLERPLIWFCAGAAFTLIADKIFQKLKLETHSSSIKSTCSACELPETKKLSDEELDKLLSSYRSWEISTDRSRITRKIIAKDFKSAFNFLSEIAKVCSCHSRKCCLRRIVWILLAIKQYKNLSLNLSGCWSAWSSSWLSFIFLPQCEYWNIHAFGWRFNKLRFYAG